MALDALLSSGASDDDALRTFFAVYAQLWPQRLSAADERDAVAYDVHALPEARVSETLRNLPEYLRLHRCGAGAPVCQPVW